MSSILLDRPCCVCGQRLVDISHMEDCAVECSKACIAYVMVVRPILVDGATATTVAPVCSVKCLEKSNVQGFFSSASN